MNKKVMQFMAQPELITANNFMAALHFWSDLRRSIPDAKGSSGAHHAWDGGYYDHIQEVLNLAEVFYLSLRDQRNLSFSLGSAILVLFLHDCEKPFKYATESQLKEFNIVERPTKSDKGFQAYIVNAYGFELTTEEIYALKYVEGEGEDYVQGKRVQSPLAAFCHMCDNTSARIFYDYPRSIR